ncbi:hypothetical protein TWF191_008694 [Orbilia oligospora]|uniref:F-box domain-containing protein n=1 Tax=Orbilia oligospora TaxID=2813651 RepID=A0A7C8UYF7_ORBOL|nr:hypothetical protein TWF191_008694 [Orbilia oligospora]
MASLITIPNEIILQIFYNLHLRDLSRAKRTCKHFNTIGKLVTNLNIKFYVDAPNQTAWKLIRSILADNTLGEKISRILVCWRRRNVNRRKTLTKYWQWTDVEKKAIIDACLLWCLTDEFSLERRVLQAFNSCLSEEDRGDTVGTRRDIANEWGYTVRDLKYGENHQYNYQGAIDEAFLNLIEKHLPKIPWPWDWDQYGLWFEENLETLGEKLPWFRNLENIEVFCQRQTFIDGLLVRFGHFCTDPTKHDELRGKGSNEPSVVEEVVESSDSGGSDSEDEIFPADKHGDTSEEESEEDEDCDQDQE